MNFISSNSAYPLLKSGSLPWSSELAKEAEELQEFFNQSKNPEELHNAVAEESFHRLAETMEGLCSYNAKAGEGESRDSSHWPDGTPEVIWQGGSTRLLSYGGKIEKKNHNLFSSGLTRGSGAISGDPRVKLEENIIDDTSFVSNKTILFVPSLINRSYILDLSEEHSMIKFLTDEGFNCLMLDWGNPSDTEAGFGMDDYISGRLVHAITHAATVFNQEIVLIGYCMGGMMALAGGILAKENVAGLVTLAAPWDFHSPDLLKGAKIGKTAENMRDTLSRMFPDNGIVPGGFVQNMLYLLGSQGLWSVHEKYRKFKTTLNPSPLEGEVGRGVSCNNAEIDFFMAREHWVHDNVDIAGRVAKECFIDWAFYNKPERGRWKIGGRAIKPSDFNKPALIAIPKYDTFVPPLSALPLASGMTKSTVIYPATGHLGMVAGKRAKEYLWLPLVKWLERL